MSASNIREIREKINPSAHKDLTRLYTHIEKQITTHTKALRNAKDFDSVLKSQGALVVLENLFSNFSELNKNYE